MFEYICLQSCSAYRPLLNINSVGCGDGSTAGGSDASNAFDEDTGGPTIGGKVV